MRHATWQHGIFNLPALSLRVGIAVNQLCVCLAPTRQEQPHRAALRASSRSERRSYDEIGMAVTIDIAADRTVAKVAVCSRACDNCHNARQRCRLRPPNTVTRPAPCVRACVCARTHACVHTVVEALGCTGGWRANSEVVDAVGIQVADADGCTEASTDRRGIRPITAARHCNLRAHVLSCELSCCCACYSATVRACAHAYVHVHVHGCVHVCVCVCVCVR